MGSDTFNEVMEENARKYYEELVHRLANALQGTDVGGNIRYHSDYITKTYQELTVAQEMYYKFRMDYRFRGVDHDKPGT